MLLDLPDDLLLQLFIDLKYDPLGGTPPHSLRDVYHFGASCKRIWRLAEAEVLWRSATALTLCRLFPPVVFREPLSILKSRTSMNAVESLQVGSHEWPRLLHYGAFIRHLDLERGTDRRETFPKVAPANTSLPEWRFFPLYVVPRVMALLGVQGIFPRLRSLRILLRSEAHMRPFYDIFGPSLLKLQVALRFAVLDADFVRLLTSIRRCNDLERLVICHDFVHLSDGVSASLASLLMHLPNLEHLQLPFPEDCPAVVLAFANCPSLRTVNFSKPLPVFLSFPSPLSGWSEVDDIHWEDLNEVLPSEPTTEGGMSVPVVGKKRQSSAWLSGSSSLHQPMPTVIPKTFSFGQLRALRLHFRDRDFQGTPTHDGGLRFLDCIPPDALHVIECFGNTWPSLEAVCKVIGTKWHRTARCITLGIFTTEDFPELGFDGLEEDNFFRAISPILQCSNLRFFSFGDWETTMALSDAHYETMASAWPDLEELLNECSRSSGGAYNARWSTLQLIAMKFHSLRRLAIAVDLTRHFPPESEVCSGSCPLQELDLLDSACANSAMLADLLSRVFPQLLAFRGDSLRSVYVGGLQVLPAGSFKTFKIKDEGWHDEAIGPVADEP